MPCLVWNPALPAKLVLVRVRVRVLVLVLVLVLAVAVVSTPAAIVMPIEVCVSPLHHHQHNPWPARQAVLMPQVRRRLIFWTCWLSPRPPHNRRNRHNPHPPQCLQALALPVAAWTMVVVLMTWMTCCWAVRLPRPGWRPSLGQQCPRQERVAPTTMMMSWTHCLGCDAPGRVCEVVYVAVVFVVSTVGGKRRKEEG